MRNFQSQLAVPFLYASFRFHSKFANIIVFFVVTRLSGVLFFCSPIAPRPLWVKCRRNGRFSGAPHLVAKPADHSAMLKVYVEEWICVPIGENPMTSSHGLRGSAIAQDPSPLRVRILTFRVTRLGLFGALHMVCGMIALPIRSIRACTSDPLGVHRPQRPTSGAERTTNHHDSSHATNPCRATWNWHKGELT